jgi:hypothetical protein
MPRTVSPAPTRIANGPRTNAGRNGTRALIANEPAMYREVISSTLREMRPDVEVFTAEPEALEGEYLRLAPRLVVFSRATEHEAPAWVALYPGGASHAVVKCPDGSRRTLPGMDFDTLLAVLDAI